MTTIWCSGCQEHHPEDQFPPSARLKHKGYCRAYERERGRRRRSTPAGRQRSNQLTRETHQRHPETLKAWRVANPDKLKLYGRTASARYLAKPENRAKANKRIKEWQQANPEKLRIYWNTRRMRLQDVGCGTITERDLRRLLERQRGLCPVCSRVMTPATMSLDHIIPISRGGKHTIGNLAYVHRRCNSLKSASTMTELRKAFQDGTRRVPLG